MGFRYIKDLPGNELIREIFYLLGGLFEFPFVHDYHLFQNPVTIPALSTGGLITIIVLKVFKKAVELRIINMNKFSHLQIEDIP